jgi:anti-sigma B factor antagonist
MVANPVAPTQELQLNVEKTPSETIFHCSGRIISSTSSQLTHAVRDLRPEKKPIVLDLSKVTFMDSSGLGALVGVWVSAKKGGSELKLISLGQRVKDLLRVTGLERVLAASRFPDTPVSNDGGVESGIGGPHKPGFGLSGPVQRLDKVFPPLFRVFAPSIP